MQPGYYYHYKHEATKPVNHYAYFVYGIGHHTEDGTQYMVYQPLYASYVYEKGHMFDIRPLAMCDEQVEVDGHKMKRFTKITDENTLKQLQVIRREMYPELFEQLFLASLQK